MSRKRFTMEQIIGLLREVDVKVSQGRIVEQICREIGITEQTYYRWRKEYGGMKTVQVKRLKELEKENTHLKKAVAELTVDKLILKEALEGNYQVPAGAGAAWNM
jgi:putative transposase